MQVPAYVEYEKATSVAHALALLARFGPEARILAGGHSLIPMMKLRLAQPETLIDINGLSELSYLTVTGGQLRIGALTRHAAAARLGRSGPALRGPARRGAGHRRPGGAELGHGRRLALPGRPVRGPVGRVRGAQGDHGHRARRRHPDRAGPGLPHRALRDRGRAGRDPDRDPDHDPARRRQRVREGRAPGRRLAGRRGRVGPVAGRRRAGRRRAGRAAGWPAASSPTRASG